MWLSIYLFISWCSYWWRTAKDCSGSRSGKPVDSFGDDSFSTLQVIQFTLGFIISVINLYKQIRFDKKLVWFREHARVVGELEEQKVLNLQLDSEMSTIVEEIESKVFG